MINTENPQNPLKERIVTAKDGIYLKIASDIYARLLVESQINSSNPPEPIKAMAFIACEATEILIREVNSRIVGYKGDSFRDE